MKFAYADPPYLGQGKKLYGHPMWDDLQTHKELIEYLQAHFSDGWTMSASSPSLRAILPLCPEDTRVGAWVKPFAVFKPNVNPAYAWEPVIFRGGRKGDRTRPTVRDWCSQVITLKKGLTGAKPPQVCQWLIELLGAEPGDVYYDVFPGTGIFTETWSKHALQIPRPETHHGCDRAWLEAAEEQQGREDPEESRERFQQG